ncbi:helix-turn-helix domain-containing protein [Cupriavidus respiraculi]|uniref:helix-turn-helix domain-containing protein n=1 Tax=Cupriavidus respiraculi TaxID=195930 RepID=UPI00398A75F5
MTVRTIEQLPQLLQAFRREAGLTQSQAAVHMGATQQTVSELERHPERVSVQKLMRLLSVLGVQIVLARDRNRLDDTPGAAFSDW